MSWDLFAVGTKLRYRADHSIKAEIVNRPLSERARKTIWVRTKLGAASRTVGYRPFENLASIWDLDDGESAA